MKLFFPLLFMATITLSATDQIQTTPQILTPTAIIAQTFTDFFNSVINLVHVDQTDLSVTSLVNSLLEKTLSLIHNLCGHTNEEKELIMSEVKSVFKKTLDDTVQVLLLSKDVNRAKHHHTNSPKDPAATQATIYNVANIVAGAVNIAQNPHDKENVGQSVGTILCGIINLAVQASYRSPDQQELQWYRILAAAPALV